jgi:membrane-bound serine protease (ClpP class)
MSAHVAVMAPGTHVGAGTPVTGEGEEASDKVVNDAVAFAVSIAEQRGRSTEFARDMVREGAAVSDREAVRSDVVDLRAPSREALLTELDGRRVVVGPQGAEHEVVLHTAGARVVEHDLGFFGEVRQLLASPELAFLFLSIGTLAVIYELASPGMGFAGVIGVVLLVLGFVALSVLPFQIGGLLLLLLAGALFAA